MLIETLSQSFRKARSVNQTSTSFPSKVPTNIEPVGDDGTATGQSVFDLSWSAVNNIKGIVAQNGVIICPYGVGSDNNTFSMRVIGWRVVGQQTPTTQIWVPVILAEVLCTISASAPGVAGCVISATEFFADTIAVVGTSGNQGVSMDLLSTANNDISSGVFDLKGFQKMELSFSTGSVATSANALIALL